MGRVCFYESFQVNNLTVMFSQLATCLPYLSILHSEMVSCEALEVIWYRKRRCVIYFYITIWTPNRIQHQLLDSRRTLAASASRLKSPLESREERTLVQPKSKPHHAHWMKRKHERRKHPPLPLPRRVLSRGDYQEA